MQCSIPFLILLLPACWAFPANSQCNFTQCGLARPNADKGYNASYPWAVSLHSSLGFYCSGSIIGPRHILTAAHCTFAFGGVPRDAKQITIIAGTADYASAFRVKLPVKNYKVHPKYVHDRRGGPYDVAVLTLEKPIEFSERIMPICLDSVGAEVGAIAVAAGWGSYKSSDCYNNQVTTNLHQGKMQVEHGNKCEDPFVPFVPKLEICAKGISAVVGGGDSGGLLMVEREGRWHQIGVTSYIPDANCNLPPHKISDVFVSVAYFHEWILNEMNK